MQHGEPIINELENEVVNNHKGCLVLNSMVYFPFKNTPECNFQFSVDVNHHHFDDFKLNHRFPNKGYYTISKRYGRRLSKIGYPYFFDIKNGPQKFLISIHVSVFEDKMNIVFPVEINVTEDNPVCGLEVRFMFQKGEFILQTYARHDDGGWESFRWYGYMNQDEIDELDNVKVMGSPGLNVETKTLFFDTVVKPVPQKLEDLLI